MQKVVNLSPVRGKNRKTRIEAAQNSTFGLKVAKIPILCDPGAGYSRISRNRIVAD